MRKDTDSVKSHRDLIRSSGRQLRRKEYFLQCLVYFNKNLVFFDDYSVQIQ